jgi:hypothetical protein
MVEERSSKEILEQCVQDLGAELGGVYNGLSSEVSWAHAKWNQYRQLYARSPERVDLLNQAASHFFGVLQELLCEDVILHLARLTDPPQIGRKDNLTLLRLPSLIPNTQLSAEVNDLLISVLTACASIRIWRNRRLAHRDLAIAMASLTDPLPGISRADIEGALASIRAMLNRVAGYYWNSKTDYQCVITSGRDADSLVYYLQLGLRAEEQRQERLERGEFLPEDIQFGSGV